MSKPSSEQVLARLSTSPNEVTAAIAEFLSALMDDARKAATSRISVNMTDYSRMPFNEQKVFGRDALTDVDGKVRLRFKLSVVLFIDRFSHSFSSHGRKCERHSQLIRALDSHWRRLSSKRMGRPPRGYSSWILILGQSSSPPYMNSK